MELYSKNKSLSSFLKLVDKDLRENGIKLILSISDVYMDNVIVAGYFSEYKREIVVKIEDNFVETLIHEYCHFLQFKNKKELWKKSKLALNVMWNWLDGVDYHKQTITKAIRIVQELELDCEKNTIDIIEKYKLPIDKVKYIKYANAYILFHNYIIKNRVWFKDGLETMKEYVDLMPLTLDGDKTKMDKCIYKVLDKYF